MSELLWQPSEARMKQSQMFAFMQSVNARFDLNLYHYHELYQWSIDHSEEFWGMLREQLSINTQPPTNYAQFLLRNPDDSLAILAFNEQGQAAELTRQALYQRVAQAQAWLVYIGIQKGDVVAGLLPNVPEAIIFMLAATAMGAIWTSCSPDFGVPAIIDRFAQVEPRALITAPGYIHKGKWIDCRDKNQTLAENLPTLIQTYCIDEPIHQTEKQVHFESLPADHPGFILYSSGTTGKPKCIVHGQSGTLIQHMKELMLHTDLKSGDRLLYLTTCGWMMWNWMASALGTGAAVILYEGNPFYPQIDSLFSLLSQAQVTVFGTSAKFLSTWQKAGVTSEQTNAFDLIHTILSTGSPLLPETFKYVYASLKQDLCLSSISGGTDIISCFALGCPLLAVNAGELQCRGLGMAVEVWNEQGKPVIEEKGELVCVKSFPSMPLMFWNDPEGIQYRKAYFNRFENVWTHGDYAMLKANGGLVIFGRSDAVLNPGGVRIGTAEIYRQVETLPTIQESLAIGLEREGNQEIILFVIMAPGQALTEHLKDAIKQRLRLNASPRHVPAQIIAVQDFPRTVNGKVSEMAVTKAVNHQPIDNLGALANPEVLDLYRGLLL